VTSGKEFSTGSSKERTLFQCVGDPPASMAVPLMAFPVTPEPTHAAPHLDRCWVSATAAPTDVICISKGAHSESFCSRQQCRAGPQDFEEEASTRWPIPWNQAPESLRKTVREKSAREGGLNS